jgi:formylglycine-generating enzyme required for sulfatase activity
MFRRRHALAALGPLLAIAYLACGGDAFRSGASSSAGPSDASAEGSTDAGVPIGDGGGDAPAFDGSCPSGRGPDMVVVAGFCIDSTEVTRGQYQQFLASASTANQIPVCSWNNDFTPTGAWPPGADQLNLPVVHVNWCDAYAFCKWAGKRMCGAIGGGPLPFDKTGDRNMSQWMRACSPQAGVDYPNAAAAAPGACNDNSSDAGRVLVVKSKASCEGSVKGLFDMVGNVDEWEDSCNGQAGEGDGCRTRGGSFKEPGKCSYLPAIATRRDGYDDTGIRCCYP